MLRGRVKGTLVSTRKVETLVGCKFMEVEICHLDKPTGEYLIAVDTVGAGIGEEVLMTTGSSARLALRTPEMPVDAVIVGIIDQ